MKKQLSYIDATHRYGKIWGLGVGVAIILVPVILCFVFSTMPEWGALTKGLIATLPMYWAVGFIEVFTYVPMLGAGGTYLSFVTGNISNLKLPCAVDAMECAGVKANSEEGEVISTISIASLASASATIRPIWSTTIESPAYSNSGSEPTLFTPTTHA